MQIKSVSLPYDYLVLATGATHSYFGHDEWAEVAPGLKRIEDAGSAGLLWAINGGRLELHRDWAVIDVPVHGSQRTFSRRNVDAAKITLPWGQAD